MEEIYKLLQQWSIKASVAQSLLEASTKATSNLMVTNNRLYKLCLEHDVDMSKLLKDFNN
jgi:hypothetical protein